jgi:hypothetical protein
MGTSFAAAGVPGGLPKNQLDGLKAFFPDLRARLPAVFLETQLGILI